MGVEKRPMNKIAASHGYALGRRMPGSIHVVPAAPSRRVVPPTPSRSAAVRLQA
jgi:hypothetical protein